MKTVVRSVYYCDHCKKRYIQKRAAKQHEKYCIKNIDRQCWNCELVNSWTCLRSLVNLCKKEVRTLDWIRRMTEDCPYCMLALAYQLNREPSLYAEIFFDWNFQEEVRQWWRDYNKEQDPRIE